MLRDPGATPTSGANETGVLDPFLNRDRTAIRTQRLLHTAGIDPHVCVWWNASPYHLGYRGPMRAHDFAIGVRSLRKFISYCTDLCVVVAMGDDAWPVCSQVWEAETQRGLPRLIRTWHPMTRGRGGAARQAELAADVREAARVIQES